MLGATVEFIAPTFVDAKERCIYFQGSTAGMIGAVDLEALAVIDAAGDIEDHGVIEEFGAGEPKAVVAVGLGERGSLFIIVGIVHVVIVI